MLQGNENDLSSVYPHNNVTTMLVSVEKLNSDSLSR